MTEEELYWAIVSRSKKNPGLCVRYGIRWFHDYDAQKSEPGFPDLVLVGRHGVLWRELKSQSGSPSPAQRAWARDLIAAGEDWAVWKPRDLESGRIRFELARLAGVEAPPWR